MKIAFYAPLKSPSHRVPSGDRQMARALMAALRLAGHEVELISEFRSFSKVPHNASLLDEARQEAVRIIKALKGSPVDLWFSYHPYYKAPDFLASEVLKQFNLPVVTAECSYAGKREGDEWAGSQRFVRQLLERSAINFCFTDVDAEGLASVVKPDSLVSLPAFIDAPNMELPLAAHSGPVQLVAVGMMRDGAKMASYQILAEALCLIKHADWQLTIVGDGPQRGRVEKLFARFDSGRILWTGQVDGQEVFDHLAGRDIFVWPGIREAYGMVYLEAQSVGLPVVAVCSDGVASVVKDGESGFLVEGPSAAGLATSIWRLIEDKALRQKMGGAAKRFVGKERSLKAASKIIARAFKEHL